MLVEDGQTYPTEPLDGGDDDPSRLQGEDPVQWPVREGKGVGSDAQAHRQTDNPHGHVPGGTVDVPVGGCGAITPQGGGGTLDALFECKGVSRAERGEPCGRLDTDVPGRPRKRRRRAGRRRWPSTLVLRAGPVHVWVQPAVRETMLPSFLPSYVDVCKRGHGSTLPTRSGLILRQPRPIMVGRMAVKK